VPGLNLRPELASPPCAKAGTVLPEHGLWPGPVRVRLGLAGWQIVTLLSGSVLPGGPGRIAARPEGLPQRSGREGCHG
jgi:hypothetical protein